MVRFSLRERSFQKRITRKLREDDNVHHSVVSGFRDKTVKSNLNVEEPSPGYFWWPDLDVDLTEEIIECPKRFLLVSSRTVTS